MSSPEPSYIALSHGRRFVVRYRPPGAIRGAMLYVPPFAEEMNKARRMAALQSRALAEQGLMVLVLDLFGCGDSDGEFAEASWARWLDDVREAAAWLEREAGCPPALWGLRAGCLLACEAARAASARCDLVLWQPAVSGRQALQQFLRLRVTAQALGDRGGERTDTRALRDTLLLGRTVEIAGYELGAGVASGLEAAELAPPAQGTRIVWLDVVAGEAAASPATQARVEAWRAAGLDVVLRPVAGVPFWQTQEIAECPALLEATCEAVREWAR